MTKDEMNKQLLQQVHSLTATVDSLNATINAQTQLIAQLNQTIQELKELDLCQYFGHKKLNFSPSITYAERIIS